MPEKKPKMPPSTGANFASESEISRFIHRDHRMHGGRASSVAFERKINRLGQREEYLSVNALDIETIPVIVDYYRKTFEDGHGQVAITIHRIKECNLAGQVAGVSVKYDRTQGSWVFDDITKVLPAYRLRISADSRSHSGIEFVKALGSNSLAEKKFSRRMAMKKKTKAY